MIDPTLSLAFGLHRNSGAYALLLGSGISRAAGIPSGWEVVLDLIRQVARLEGQDCEPDPAGWYRAVHGEEPNYSVLLDRLASRPAERRQILRGYFEPDDTERAEGRKLPTAAHRAIAKLAASGHIRVVLTTNFDRLLETAMRDEGLSPAVISTADGVQGAMPLALEPVTIIKLHGDYLDTRILNTPAELTRYARPMARLLARVLDEYGLVICGWSAEYDAALRDAILACPSRRFTTYWAVYGTLDEGATRLAEARRAERIHIQGADAFFEDLAEKVQALIEFDRPHPLSVQAAVRTAKRYLEDPTARIRLRELVVGEVEELHSALLAPTMTQGPLGPVKGAIAEAIEQRLQRLEALTERVVALVATGCYWDEGARRGLWVQVLEQLAPPLEGRMTSGFWDHLLGYPALLLLYAGGIAALAAGREETLAALLAHPRILQQGRERPLLGTLSPDSVIDRDIAKQLPRHEREYTPLSNRMLGVLREPLREYVPDHVRYERLFDRFEFLYALAFADQRDRDGMTLYGPPGRFGWRHEWSDQYATLKGELLSAGREHPLLRAGLFGGDPERLQAIERSYQEVLGTLHWY